jgi:hypothetical protein
MQDLKIKHKQLAIDVATLLQQLPKSPVNRAYSDQLIRSSSSPSTNFRAAYSKKPAADVIKEGNGLLAITITSIKTREASHLVPRPFHLVLRTFYLVPSTSYLLPRTSYLLPRTSYLLPRTSYLLPRTSYLPLRTFYLVPRTF